MSNLVIIHYGKNKGSFRAGQKSTLEPELTCSCSNRKIRKKNSKTCQKFWIFLVMNVYMFSTYMSNFVTKWYFCWSVQKRQNHCSENIFRNLNLVIRFVFFAQSRKNIISSRNFARMLKTCLCSSPKNFRIF